MPFKNPRRRAGMLQFVARILLIPGWVLAIAILMKGYSDIGDGFAAGVIAALVVILQGFAFGAEEFETLPLARIAPVMSFIGLFIVLCVAFMPVLFGYPILTHWPLAGHHPMHFGALEFITPVAFDIGVFCIVFGFCVGVMVTLAHAEQREFRSRARARRKERAR